MPFTNDLIRERQLVLALELNTLEVHNGLRQSDGMAEDEITERVEQANLFAEQFIELAGFDLGDSDRRGAIMGGTVRDLLTAVALLIGPDECNGVLNS